MDKNREIVRSQANRFLSSMSGRKIELDEVTLDDLLRSLEGAIEAGWEVTNEWTEVTPSRPGTIGLVVTPRRKMRPTKSIKPSNVEIDRTTTGYALIASLLGVNVVTVGLSAAVLPVTFFPFLLALGFAIYKAFEKQISYEEAALLHALQKHANFHRVISAADANSLGKVLVTDYGYKKGANENELATLLDKLVAINAIKPIPEGYRVVEEVVFWRGTPS